MTGHGVAMATRKEKQWNAQNTMAFTMSQTHSVHIHLTSHHYTSHHRHTHTHTHTQGCQDDLGIPLILMDIKIISALIRQNALEYKNEKGLKPSAEEDTGTLR